MQSFSFYVGSVLVFFVSGVVVVVGISIFRLQNLELGNVSGQVGFVFGLNLNGLKNSKPEPDLFNKRVENLNPNRLRLKRVGLNPTRLSKQVKRVGFRLPIYLPTQLISNPQKFTSPHEKEKKQQSPA